MDAKSGVETVPASIGASSTVVGIEPAAAFSILTDLAHLPTWNKKMVRVLALPDRVEPGAEWVVEFAMFGRKWKSRSRVGILDPVAHRFEYRTQTDDGNPSFTEWKWAVEPRGEGCHVNVSWDLHPLTFWRRAFFSRVRAGQLGHNEVPASLAALAAMADREQTSR